MDLLRFITAGNVDDGKSTLIGRLLYDSNSISLDVLNTLEKQSKIKHDSSFDLALLTDGLRAEREQGITIDVAYKYFTTEKRKFIIADAPGHVQYTRNMITGASNVNLIIILIDARLGITEQTRRHSIIASLLDIPHVLVCINKMDLVGFDQNVYENIVKDYQNLASQLSLTDVKYMPISALLGDNIVNDSKLMAWYTGQNLLSYIENIKIDNDYNYIDTRFQVQYIIRPQTKSEHDYRGYAGKIISGVYKVGDKVKVYPEQIETSITKIEINQKEEPLSYVPQSVVMHLANQIDISRGDSICKIDSFPSVTQVIDASICWMDSKSLNVGSKFLLQHNSNTVKAVVKEIKYKIDVNTMNKNFDTDNILLNEICMVNIKTASPICVDTYKNNRSNGAFILIDENTNSTVAAGMIEYAE
jgi:sulfate adenylyltransferase subunit 1